MQMKRMSMKDRHWTMICLRHFSKIVFWLFFKLWFMHSGILLILIQFIFERDELLPFVMIIFRRKRIVEMRIRKGWIFGTKDWAFNNKFIVYWHEFLQFLRFIGFFGFEPVVLGLKLLLGKGEFLIGAKKKNKLGSCFSWKI